MKATLEIERSHLRHLLQSINKINSVPDEDIHADIHLKAKDEQIQLYSYVPPSFVTHRIGDGDDITVDIETTGEISFNIETLSEIVQKAEDGVFEIEFNSDKYHLVTPSGDSFSAVEFDLPRHAESVFEDPLDVGELYKIDTVSRTEFRSGLSTMGVIGEFANISVDEEDTLVISIQNKVTGDAKVKKEDCGANIISMSQFYMIQPMREFTSTLIDAEEVTVLVSNKKNICLRTTIDSWIAEVHMAGKASTELDTHLNL